MKVIILVGGACTRPYPIISVISKQISRFMTNANGSRECSNFGKLKCSINIH